MQSSLNYDLTSYRNKRKDHQTSQQPKLDSEIYQNTISKDILDQLSDIKNNLRGTGLTDSQDQFQQSGSNAEFSNSQSEVLSGSAKNLSQSKFQGTEPDSAIKSDLSKIDAPLSMNFQPDEVFLTCSDNTGGYKDRRIEGILSNAMRVRGSSPLMRKKPSRKSSPDEEKRQVRPEVQKTQSDTNQSNHKVEVKALSIDEGVHSNHDVGLNVETMPKVDDLPLTKKHKGDNMMSPLAQSVDQNLNTLKKDFENFLKAKENSGDAISANDDKSVLSTDHTNPIADMETLKTEVEDNIQTTAPSTLR